MKRITEFCYFMLTAIALTTLVETTFADDDKKGADLSKAKSTVDSIRQADPPSVSTSTSTSSSSTVVGTPASDFKPTGPSVKPKEPPSPSN